MRRGHGGTDARTHGRTDAQTRSGPPGPAGVPAVVARHHLAGIGDVGEEPGEKLERVEGLGAGRGPVALVFFLQS